MECDELIRLRSEAQALRKELEDRRNKARERKDLARPDRPNAFDYDGFLRRKINRAATAIEQHVAKHQCQD
ncbi:MAG: hypothetical protein M3P27_09360 [Acidobacteriota bacterium]|nr:hypothetical protein [Acidobacteriota bacterium]